MPFYLFDWHHDSLECILDDYSSWFNLLKWDAFLSLSIFFHCILYPSVTAFNSTDKTLHASQVRCCCLVACPTTHKHLKHRKPLSFSLDINANFPWPCRHLNHVRIWHELFSLQFHFFRFASNRNSLERHKSEQKTTKLTQDYSFIENQIALSSFYV